MRSPYGNSKFRVIRFIFLIAILNLAAPTGFDQIVLLDRGARHVSISWDPPAMSNGILVNYTVLLGGGAIAATPPTTLDYNVTELLPFTAYNFSVMACTSAGCVESSDLMVTTREDGK